MATSAMSAAQQQQAAANANASARQVLLSSALRENVQVSAQNGTGSQPLLYKLQNVGILTSIDLLFTINLTNSGSTAATPNIGFPYTLINQIQFKDYNGDYRVQASGRQLANLQSVRHQKPWQGGFSLAEGAYTGAAFSYPTSAATTIAAGGTETVSFWMRVPIAYDPESNLTGALLMQSATGECYLNITPESNFSGAYDAPFGAVTGGAVSVVSTSVTTVQNFLQPQQINSQSLPLQDLQTVYEINSYRTNSNIAQNQTTYINYPNSRTVLAAHVNYANGSAFTYGTDMSKIQTILSGATIMTNIPPILNFLKLRETLKSDAHPGFYYQDQRKVPIVTTLFGQVQFAFTPSVVNANAYFDVLFESFYSTSMVLPGLQS